METNYKKLQDECDVLLQSAKEWYFDSCICVSFINDCSSREPSQKRKISDLYMYM